MSCTRCVTADRQLKDPTSTQVAGCHQQRHWLELPHRQVPIVSNHSRDHCLPNRVRHSPADQLSIMLLPCTGPGTEDTVLSATGCHGGAVRHSGLGIGQVAAWHSVVVLGVAMKILFVKPS